jgi:hypothetical protein
MVSIGNQMARKASEFKSEARRLQTASWRGSERRAAIHAIRVHFRAVTFRTSRLEVARASSI